MPTLVYLGTGAAVPGPRRDNTSLAFDDGREVTLVDASGSPLKRLAEAGLPHQRLARVIITHEHLDHTFGLPSLLQGLWLLGRRESLPIYALPETWRFLDRLIDAYRPASWTDGFPIDRRTIIPGSGPFLETPTFSARAALGRHSAPCVGLRFETADGGSFAYSSDTSVSREIEELARDCDLLAHEATYLAGREAEALAVGHSTARQAAEAAARAGVARLALVHFTPVGDGDLAALRAGAATAYTGPIDVPSDYDRQVLSF